MSVEIIPLLAAAYIFSAMLAIYPAVNALIMAREQRKKHSDLSDVAYWSPLVLAAAVFISAPGLNTFVGLRFAHSVIYMVVFELIPYLFFQLTGINRK